MACLQESQVHKVAGFSNALWYSLLVLQLFWGTICIRCAYMYHVPVQGCVRGIVCTLYNQLPLRQIHLGPAPTVCLREVSALEGDEVND